MVRIIVFLLVATFSYKTAVAQEEKKEIEATIRYFFDGLSEIDVQKLRDHTTADFHLLEMGEVWTLDTLINKIAPRKGLGIVRVNRFDFIRVEQTGSIAWVSYFNRADMSFNEKKRSIKWLESAVLVKEKGKWRIQLLHSTEMEIK